MQLSTRARTLTPDGHGFTIHTTAEEFEVDGVVCAVPPPAAVGLLPAGVPALPAGWHITLGRAPIVNVHVVYDRPVLTAPFAAGVATPVQWVFDRTVSAGLHRVHPPPAQYLAVSLSAADEEIGLPARVLLRRILPRSPRCCPPPATPRSSTRS